MKKIMFFFGLIISNPFSGSKNDEIIGQSDVINSSIKHKNINWKNMIYGTVGIGGIGIIIAVIWRAFSRKSGNGKGGNDGSDNGMEELKNLNINQKLKQLKSLFRLSQPNKPADLLMKNAQINEYQCNYQYNFFNLFGIIFDFNSNIITIVHNPVYTLEYIKQQINLKPDNDFKKYANYLMKILRNFSFQNKTIKGIPFCTLNHNDKDQKNQETINNILDNLILAVSAFNELNKLPKTQ